MSRKTSSNILKLPATARRSVGLSTAMPRPPLSALVDADVFKDMIDNSLQGIILHRRQKPLYVNKSWAELHGYTVDDVMAMPSIQPLVHASEGSRLCRFAVNRVAGRHAPNRYRYRANHSSGKSIWLEVFVRVIDWQGDKAIHCAVIDVDAEEARADEMRQEQLSMEEQLCQRNEALERSDRQIHLYASIIDQVSERISVIGTDYRMRMTNRANLDFWQRSWDQLIGHHLRDILGEVRFETMAKSLLDSCFAGQSVRTEGVADGPGGRQSPIAISADPFRSADGEITGAIVLVRDITEAKRAEKQLRLFASVVEQVSDRISVIGTDYRVRMTNKANLDYHRKPIEAFVKRHIAELMGEQEFLTYSKPELDRCFAGETVKCRRNGMDGAGQRRKLDILLEPYRDADGSISGVVATVRDVTEAHLLSERLAYQASHDELTGLVNRRAFEQHLQASITETADNCRSAAFCFIDLDQFKIINDTLGHLVGDQLLKEVAKLLSARLRSGDVLARLGGDEFGLLLIGCSLRRAQRAAANLVAALNDYRFVHEGQVFEVGASIGIAAINRYTSDISEIMSQADLACYAAKDNGRNRVHVFQKQDMFLRRRREEMFQAGGIRSALDDNQFTLFAQPITAVKQAGERPDRVEILLRMQGDDDELIMPSAFIPAAERYGLMADIDRWVVKNTVAHLACNRAGSSNLQVNINISGVTLSDETLLEYVRLILIRSDVSPTQICFEITETAAIQNLGKTQDFMKELKNWGCRFALDDFGSGLSSLNYLKRLPVDYLKIDGAFVRDVKKDRGSRVMVMAIHRMARGLGIETVAEGVEDRLTLCVLKELGVDFVQGFAVGKPRPLVSND